MKRTKKKGFLHRLIAAFTCVFTLFCSVPASLPVQASLSDGQQITLTSGGRLSYEIVGIPKTIGGNTYYNTNYFQVSDASGATGVAYCIEPAKATPALGNYTASVMNDSWFMLKRVLYYGYGGPGDMTAQLFPGYNDSQRYILTHIMASYSYKVITGEDAYAGTGMTDESLDPGGIYGYIGDALRAMANRTLCPSYVSTSSISGTYKNNPPAAYASEDYYWTDALTISGTALVGDGLLMYQEGTDLIWGGPYPVYADVGENARVRFARTKASVDAGRTSDTVTIQGVSNAIAFNMSDGNSTSQMVSYMYANGDNTSLNITWNGGPNADTTLRLNKTTEFLSTATGSSGNITFGYSRTGLPGATFGLYAASAFTDYNGVHHNTGDLISSGTTNSSGQLDFSGIPYGNDVSNGYRADFYIKETSTGNSSIALDNTQYPVTLTYSGGDAAWSGSIISSNQANLVNSRKHISVSAYKVNDKNTGIALPGAEFTLYNASDITNNAGTVILSANTAIQTVATGSDGKATFTANIPYGYGYYIKETKAPVGYVISTETKSFTFNSGSANSSIVFSMNPTEAGYGKYVVHEYQIPEGRKPVDDQEIEIKEDDRNGYINDDVEYTMIDYLKRITTHKPVHITKFDATGSKELPGATLTLTDKDGNIIDEWVSTKEPHKVYGLYVGESYTLTERLSPKGFMVSEPVTFTISGDWTVSQKVGMYDALDIHLKTGDDDMIFVYAALTLALSMIFAGYVYIIFYRRKKLIKA